jgi:hypothetical protein
MIPPIRAGSLRVQSDRGTSPTVPMLSGCRALAEQTAFGSDVVAATTRLPLASTGNPARCDRQRTMAAHPSIVNSYAVS